MIVIVNCTRRKARSSVPAPAWSVYQGTRVPELARELTTAGLLKNLWFVSALHGLVHSLDEITPYDVTVAEADPTLGERVVRQANARIQRTTSILIAVEPDYLGVLDGLRTMYRIEYWDPSGRYDELPTFAARWLAG